MSIQGVDEHMINIHDFIITKYKTIYNSAITMTTLMNIVSVRSQHCRGGGRKIT